MNSGNPIEVVPLRATTGLCGGAIHCATSSLSQSQRAQTFRKDETFAFDFRAFRNFSFCVLRLSTFAVSLFEVLRTFALYNSSGAA